MEHLRAPVMHQEGFLLVAIGVEVQRKLSSLMIECNYALVTAEDTETTIAAGDVGIIDRSREQLASWGCNYTTKTFGHLYSPCISL